MQAFMRLRLLFQILNNFRSVNFVNMEEQRTKDKTIKMAISNELWEDKVIKFKGMFCV